MKIQKEKNVFFNDVTDIHINDENKNLYIMYGGNFDLYWKIVDTTMEYKDEIKSIGMEITKENYGVYSSFEKLFQDMKDINLYDDTLMTEEDKNAFRKYNNANYNDLYQDDTITWYSDETHSSVANYVIIKKENEKFLIDFYVQPYEHGYDQDTHHFNSISVRFRNSGSRYDPFNILFMNMFRKLQNVDDINDIGHQYHFEEILYEEQKKLSRKK